MITRTNTLPCCPIIRRGKIGNWKFEIMILGYYDIQLLSQYPNIQISQCNHDLFSPERPLNQMRACTDCRKPTKPGNHESAPKAGSEATSTNQKPFYFLPPNRYPIIDLETLVRRTSRALGHASLYDSHPDETKSPVIVRSVAGFLLSVDCF